MSHIKKLLEEWLAVADQACDCEECGPCKLAVKTRATVHGPPEAQGILVVGYDEEEMCMEIDETNADLFDCVGTQADNLEALSLALKTGNKCASVVFTQRATEKLVHWIDRKNWGQDDEDDPMREGAV